MVDRRDERVDPRSGADPVVDGRRLRRERGRRAVVDAMIDLVLEGHGPPNADEVTDRAGVSQASLFRYFATLDELRQAAIGRYFERFDDLISVPEIGDGPLGDRIDRFVAGRDAFYRRTEPMARLTRRQTDEVADFAATIERVRATFADQVAQHFAPELGRFQPAERQRRVALIAVLTSFEGWDQLATLGDDGRAIALRQAIADLLGVT